MCSRVVEDKPVRICDCRVGEHIPLGIYVSWLGKELISRGRYFSRVEKEHISLGICVSTVRRTHITRDVCFPGRGTHITSDTCFLGRRTHITRDMCFMGRVGAHITCDVRQKVYVHLLFVEFRRT